MHVAVELSLYPLTEGFIPPILDFIERLKVRTVDTNRLFRLDFRGTNIQVLEKTSTKQYLAKRI